MRRPGLILAVVGAAAVLWLSAAPSASAHGGLVDADPGPGDSADVGLTTIRLEFEELAADEPLTVTVTDGSGADVVRDVQQHDGGDVVVTVAPLERGVYLLGYVVTPADGHATKGGYYLEVVAPGEEPTRARDQGRQVAIAVGVTAVLAAVGAVIVLRRRRPGTPSVTD